MLDMGNCHFCDNGVTHEVIGNELTIEICSNEDCYMDALDYLDDDEPALSALYF